MPTPSNKARLEQVKRRLGIAAVNPFDRKGSTNHNNALGKTQQGGQKHVKQHKPTSEPAAPRRFDKIEDERMSGRESQVSRNYAQSRVIREQVNEKGPEGFEAADKQNVQEIYMEIMQKSKAAKKERQMLKQELDAQIKKLDGAFNRQVQKVVPKGFGGTGVNTIRAQFQTVADGQANGDLRHGVLNPNTIEEQIRLGATKLQQANKVQQNVQKQQNVSVLRREVQAGGDDEGEQFAQDDEFLAAGEEMEETEEFTEQEAPVGLEGEQDAVKDNQHADAANPGFSLALQQIPFVLSLPDDYNTFAKMLNKVEAGEEIVLWDRLIKATSTFLDKANIPVMERFVGYSLRRLQEVVADGGDWRRADAAMRALRHQTLELPSAVAAQYHGQIMKQVAEFQEQRRTNSEYPAVGGPFLVLLRAYALCYIQSSFPTDGELQNASMSAYLTTLEYLVFNASVADSCARLAYLVALKLLLSVCCQLNRFSGGLLHGLQRLHIANLHDCNEGEEKTNKNDDGTKIQIDMDCALLQKKAPRETVHQFVHQEIVQALQLLFWYFKPNFEFLPRLLAELLYKNYHFNELTEVQQIVLSDQYVIELYQNEEQFITYNHNINFLKQRQHQIREQTPLVQRTFNPKRTNMLDIDKQRQQIQQKYQKRKQKDDYRKEVKELQKKSLQRQNELIAHKIELQKIKNQALQRNRFDEKYQKPKRM